jgi:hypothetical protein
MNKGYEVLNPINIGLEVSDSFGLDPQDSNGNCTCPNYNCHNCDCSCYDNNCACNDIDCSTRMVNR